MTEIEKLEATVKELAETVKHTVDEQSALCMRVNLLEEGGLIESPPINGKLVRLEKTDDGYAVDVLDADCHTPLEAFSHDKMMDAMLDYQTQLGVIRNTTNGINNSSDLAIAVANDEVVYPSEPEPMHFISSCGEVYVNADGTINEKSELSDYLLNIAKFDMEELRSWDQRTGIDRDCGDTLELAYWDKDGEYCEPDWEWRQRTKGTNIKRAIEKQKAWIRTYRKQPEPEPKLRHVWVEYNVINWEDKEMTKVGAVFPPVVVDDIENFLNAVGEMKEGDMQTEHYADARDGEHSMNDTDGKPVGIPCSYSRCYMVTRKTDEEILKDFKPKWFVDDPCDEAGNLPPPEPEPKRFKIYGDEYPEIWAHFKGKDYNPKFEEELVVQFHNHRESRDH